MPFKIVNRGRDTFMLQRIEDKSFVNKVFRTKEKAISAGINFMAYRGEIGYYSPPDKILARKQYDPYEEKQRYSSAPRTTTDTGGKRNRRKRLVKRLKKRRRTRLNL